MELRIRISNWQRSFEEDAEVVLHDVDERNVLFAQFPAQRGGRCHPLLKHCIPDAHERIQLLHHACTYQSKQVFFVVGNDEDVMAIYSEVWATTYTTLQQCLIQRYSNVCRISSGCIRRKNLFQPPQRVGGPQSTTRS